MVLFIDSREKEYAKEWFKGKIVNKVKKLDIGDYNIDDTCGNTLYIEKKLISDLYSSLTTERFDRQMKNMSAVDLTVLVISGSLDEFEAELVDIERIKSILKHGIIDAVLRYGIRSVVWLKTNEEAMEYILGICKDFEKNTIDKHPSKRIRGNNKKHNLLRTIMGIPHDTATALLKEYKTISTILKTSDRELLKYNGVGQIRIKNMRELFD